MMQSPISSSSSTSTAQDFTTIDINISTTSSQTTASSTSSSTTTSIFTSYLTPLILRSTASLLSTVLTVRSAVLLFILSIMGPEPNKNNLNHHSNPGGGDDLKDPNLNPEAPVIRERKISNINAIKAWEAEASSGTELPHHHHVHLHHNNVHHDVEKKIHNDHNDHDHDSITAEKKASHIKTRKSAQFLSAIAANMGAFILGTVMAWSATGLPSLRASGDLGEITKGEEAWIGSIVTLAALFSCPIASYAMVTFGRRRSMLLLTGPCIAGWLCIAFAEVLPSFLPQVYTIYFGRILTGFCGGSFSVIVPVFIAECSHEKLRGGLAAGFDIMLSSGMLFVYIVGAYTSWKIQALSCGMIPLFVHGLLLLCSESPRFLVEQGQIAEATYALSWLFGYKEEALSTEISILIKSVEESQAKPVNVDRVLFKMSVLKPILICSAMMFFYTMCVYDAVIFYTVDIFKSTGTDLDPKNAAIIIGVVGVVSSFPALLIVEKCGRRILLLISEALLCGSLAAMGAFFFITSSDTEDDNSLHSQYGWLPLTALNVFIIGYAIGLGPIALLLVGEIVPSHIKGLTTCFALMIRWILGFGVTNLFETLESSIGIDKTYWIFSMVCGFGVLFVYFCVPETKGKSLDDIQTGFIHKSKLKAMNMNGLNNNIPSDNNLNNISCNNNGKGFDAVMNGGIIIKPHTTHTKE